MKEKNTYTDSKGAVRKAKSPTVGDLLSNRKLVGMKKSWILRADENGFPTLFRCPSDIDHRDLGAPASSFDEL